MSTHSPIIVAHFYALVWSGQIDIKSLPAEYPYRETWAQYLRAFKSAPWLWILNTAIPLRIKNTAIEGRILLFLETKLRNRVVITSLLNLEMILETYLHWSIPYYDPYHFPGDCDASLWAFLNFFNRKFIVYVFYIYNYVMMYSRSKIITFLKHYQITTICYANVAMFLIFATTRNKNIYAI